MSSPLCSQALQAPACHENLVKVGGYILGEFGNLIAGDSRSRCLVLSHYCGVLFSVINLMEVKKDVRSRGFYLEDHTLPAIA